MNPRTLATACTFLLMAGCAGDGADLGAESAELGQAPGAVFTLTNESGANRVLAFARAAGGTLSAPVAYATDGAGSGDGLGAQAALVLSGDHRYLLAVNPGSNDVTTFAVEGAELSLVDRVSSGGLRPISVAERQGLVYVLNVGGAGNVAGFRLDADGRLEPIDGASQPLSGGATGAAQVAIAHDRSALVVSEKATNQLTVYGLDGTGRAGAPVAYATAGRTPFGFEITRGGRVIVSEAASASASSYQLSRDGGLTTISAVVPATQAAPCWLVLSQDDRFAFVANAGSSSIATYAVGNDGALELLDARAGEIGRPLDLAVDAGGRGLYGIDRASATLAAFRIHAGGALEPLGTAGALPATATGLAAY